MTTFRAEQALWEGFGDATTFSDLTSFTLPIEGTNCGLFTADQTITLVGNGSALQLEISGTVCFHGNTFEAAMAGDPLRVEATFTVKFGTGIFDGATGGGINVATAAGDQARCSRRPLGSGSPWWRCAAASTRASAAPALAIIGAMTLVDVLESGTLGFFWNVNEGAPDLESDPERGYAKRDHGWVIVDVLDEDPIGSLQALSLDRRPDPPRALVAVMPEEAALFLEVRGPGVTHRFGGARASSKRYFTRTVIGAVPVDRVRTPDLLGLHAYFHGNRSLGGDVGDPRDVAPGERWPSAGVVGDPWR